MVISSGWVGLAIFFFFFNTFFIGANRFFIRGYSGIFYALFFCARGSVSLSIFCSDGVGAIGLKRSVLEDCSGSQRYQKGGRSIKRDLLRVAKL
jgi:hypothetical protein